MPLQVILFLLPVLMGVFVSAPAYTDELLFRMEIKNHLFVPDTLAVPSGVRFRLIIENRDPTPEEFESFELNREKVIMGNASAVVYIGPLKPGTYPFFGEFNPETAQGQLIATP